MAKSSQTIPSMSLLKSLSLQLLLLSGTASLQVVSPQTTQASIPSTLLSSRTTAAEAAGITNAPKFDPQRIFARQNTQSNLCAYVNGDINKPLLCPTGFDCKFLDTESQAWGCCNDNSCTNAPRTCFGSGDSENFCQFIDCKSLYTSILTCSGNKPACVTYQLDNVGFTIPGYAFGPKSFSCGPVPSVINVLASPTNGGSDSEPTDSSTNSNSGNNGDNEDPVQPAATTRASSTSKNNSNNDNNNDNDNNGGKRLDVGTIIGIAAAVAGVFATIMVGLFPRQMTKCLTCGMRPKKEVSNEEMRRMAWAYLRPGGGQGGHHQPLYNHGAPMGIGLEPIPAQQMAWNQQQWQGQQQQQWGPNTGYGAPPPAYNANYGHQPGPYNNPQAYQGGDQRQPFLQHKAELA